MILLNNRFLKIDFGLSTRGIKGRGSFYTCARDVCVFFFVCVCVIYEKRPIQHP